MNHDPLGVALIIGAWNYNTLLTLQPLIGCIAAGNCALLKGGNYAAHTCEAIERAVKKYLDPDCIKMIQGDRHATAALLEKKFDVVFFTGSASVGRIIAAGAAKHLTPCVLELGGKSPCIIDHTADLDVAAARVCWGALMNSGQTCVRPDYFLVHTKVKEVFTAKLKAKMKLFYSEEPQSSEWYGRLINVNAHRRLMSMIQDGRERGAEVTGGAGDEATKYIEPTVLDFGQDADASPPPSPEDRPRCQPQLRA